LFDGLLERAVLGRGSLAHLIIDLFSPAPLVASFRLVLLFGFAHDATYPGPSLRQRPVSLPLQEDFGGIASGFPWRRTVAPWISRFNIYWPNGLLEQRTLPTTATVNYDYEHLNRPINLTYSNNPTAIQMVRDL